MDEKILLVDDEPTVLAALERSLQGNEYRLFTAQSATEALAILAEEEMDVLISDQLMPDMSGAELLSVVAVNYPDTVNVLLTAHPSVELALDAVNAGQIFGFLVKPWNDIRLEAVIDNALQQRRIRLRAR